jgi:Family of unknown function (DUF6263)
MKKISPIILIALASSLTSFSQKVSGKIEFQQGQTIGITIELKTTVSQEAGGNTIDFTADGTAIHSFKVTNATDENSTLRHQVNRIAFSFDGMGQKRSFDSENKKDPDQLFGKTVKDLLSKTYDMVVDPAGNVLIVRPEKIEQTNNDDRLSIVLNMLKDVTSIVYPPKKNEASFFKVLPEAGVALNESWTETGGDSSGVFKTTYTLSAITDSVLIVDVKGQSSTITNAEMMGMQTSTTMNNAYTGKIIIDKASGIIREKTMTTVSNGSTEAMGGTMPVTSKTTVTIKLKPVP